MDRHVETLHEIGSLVAAADPLHEVLDRVVELIASVIPCDACIIYMQESKELVLRASLAPHPGVVDRLTLGMGRGITGESGGALRLDVGGWVAEHREPVAVGQSAFRDPRFRFFQELPEDRYEALLSVPLLSGGQTVGVINLHHRLPHNHTAQEIKFVSTIGFLVGSEVARARLESEVAALTERLEARKVVERAKGLLQSSMGVTEAEAYHTLQRQSRQRRKPMREIAEAILLAEEVRERRG